MNYKNNCHILIALLSAALISMLLSFYFIKTAMILITVFFILSAVVFTLFMNNISQKKIEKIKEMQNKYIFISELSKSILNELEYALVVADKELNIIEISSNFNDIFCINDNDNVNLNYFIQKNIKNNESFNKKMEILKNGNFIEKCSMELILKNNKIIKMVVFYINNPAAIKEEEYIFLFKDCTEERKNSTNFEILISNIDEMTAIYDSEMRVVKYNAAYKKFFIDFEEVEVYFKLNFLEQLTGDKYIFWKEIFERGLNGEKVSKEIKYFNNSGEKSSEINIEVTSIYNSSSEITGFIVSIKDINKIKYMESEIIKLREEIGKNIGEKEIFFDNLNSEIRTPLNNIINGIELININENSNKESELIEILKSSGESLLTLLNDMSDYLKIGNESNILKKELFDIEKTLSAVIKEFKENNKLLPLNIKLNILNVANREIYGDSIKLKNIINTILNNISKLFYTEQISINIKENDSLDNKAEFEIVIINESSNKTNDFEHEKNITEGIGVLIAEKTILSMNGKILFKENRKNRGKYGFSIYFEKSEEKPVVNSKTSFAKLKNKKVLIVEDNRMNQIVMEKLLKIVKIETDLAENGFIAFEKYKKNYYDLILMDIQMPIMNGYELSKKIREYEKELKRKIPIIALTAYAMQSDREKCLDAGMDDYMSKPVIKNELFEMIEKYIK